MNWDDLKKRLWLGRHRRLARFQLPPLVLELQPGFVTATRLDTNARQPLLARIHQIEVGTITPSANKPNVTKPAALHHAVEEVVSVVGNGSDRLGLLIPDLSARVAVLEFDALPDNRLDADELVQWRLSEVLPFQPEQALISYQILGRRPGAVDVLAMALQRSIRAEYEAVVESLNRHPVLVLPTSVALLPLLPEDSSAQLLLHLCPGSLTAIVLSFNRVCYWRTLTLESESVPGSDEVGREATRVLAACQDHLKLAVQDIWFCARPPEAAAMREPLAKALGRRLRSLPNPLDTPDSMPEADAETWQHFGTPFAGLIANLETQQ